MRTVEWDYPNRCLCLIDQRLLPNDFQVISITGYRQLASAIQDMVVRGAPAIGAAAAFGLALAAKESNGATSEEVRGDVRQAAGIIRAARPTAVNLGWALDRILQATAGDYPHPEAYIQAVLAAAQQLADEDVAINQSMARHGAALISDGDTIIHHCNTGALAAVDWGTALGVIRMAFHQGKRIHVLVDETRPRLQGARLTAWELQQLGISYEIITDSAAGYFLRSGQVQNVFFGADRVAANGDVANKIGTYMLALAAKDNNVPAYAVVPTSTVDLSLSHGDLIPIEERDPGEVLNIQAQGQPIAPSGSKARNPAFDITPNRLLAAIVTEHGVVRPPFTGALSRLIEQSKGMGTSSLPGTHVGN